MWKWDKPSCYLCLFLLCLSNMAMAQDQDDSEGLSVEFLEFLADDVAWHASEEKWQMILPPSHTPPAEEQIQ